MIHTAALLADLRNTLVNELNPQEAKTLRAHMALESEATGRTLDYEKMTAADVKFWRKLMLEFAKAHGLTIRA
jgi:hypothetical protein